jgi:hypothetical protein
MMKDPAFQKQMKAMMGDKTVQDATERAKVAFGEMSKDPARMTEIADRMQRMMGGEDMRPDLSESMRKEARAAAGQQFGIKPAERALDGASNAQLGLKTLQESLSDPKAMAEAMEMMKDPSMINEVRRMMADPSFRDEFASIQESPQYRAAIMKSAEAMSTLMNDPGAAEKVQRQMAEFAKRR